MLRLVKRFWQILAYTQRRRVLMLTGGVIVMAVLEVGSISVIAPFLALASDPTMIGSNAVLSFLYDLFNFQDADIFLITVGLGVFLLLLLSNTWSAMTTWAQLRLVWSWNHQLSIRLLERYLYRPYGYFISRNTADLSKTLLSEVQQVTNQMIMPVLVAIGKLVVALGIVMVLVAMNPFLAVLVISVVGGSYGVIYIAVRKRLDIIGRDRVKANRERFTVAGEALGGIKDVKVFNVEQEFIDRFNGPSRRFALHEAMNQTIGRLPRYAIETIAFGTVILIIVYLIALEGDFGNIIPMIGVYAFAGYRLMPALQQLFHGITAVRFNSPALETLLRELEDRQDSETKYSRRGTSPMGLRSGLELRDISFTYPLADRPAIEDVSLAIPKNCTVGFVGATGSGKTTLADVILGLLRPQTGEILVDGVPISDTNLSSWQLSLGYVPQHIFLNDASVAENIAYGVPKDQIDIEAVRSAARIAQIDDFIMEELPNGYQTVVGERGIRLSGGQRQRIGIARALYRNPDVIVFDEATSALDSNTENHLMDAMKSLLGRKTIIMIAHRMTTLVDCDTVYMLEGGRLVAVGSYQALISGVDGFKKVQENAAEKA